MTDLNPFSIIRGRRKRRVKNLMKNMFGSVLSLIILVPFVVICVNSLKNQADANKLGLTLEGATWELFVDNYTYVIERSNYLSSLRNSVMVTGISTTVSVLIGSMASFVVVRRRTRPLKFINSAIIMGLTLPGLMVVNYFTLNRVGLTTGTGAFTGAILLYIAGRFPFTYFIYTGFIKGVSPEIDEAAIIDGVNPLGLFFRIVFPLLKPVTITIIVSASMAIWNDFQTALYFLNDPARSTVVMSTYMFMAQKASTWNFLFANVVLVSLPIVTLFLCLQRYIVSGLSSGAVKG